MNKKVIYLAGGCYWGVEKFISNLKGVLETTVGFANGHVEAPSYEQVKHTDTGHAETVRVVYDADVMPLPLLLDLFYKIIDPTTVDQQGEDIGNQYRTGVYFTDEADGEIVAASVKKLAAKYEVPLALEVCPLDSFWDAEEYHQKYLDKNPGGYCHVPWDMIKWAQTVDPEKYEGEN